MKQQCILFEILVRQETNEQERPVDGWKLLERKPGGFAEITSRRGNVIKYNRLPDALKWIRKNRQGYMINISCYGYTGTLKPDKAAADRNPFLVGIPDE